MKNRLFEANWTTLGCFYLAVLAMSAGSYASPPFELPPQTVADKGYKSLDSVAIEGQSIIPAQVLRRKLAQLPGIVEATHPSMSQSAFRQRVVDALRRGYLASGFLDREVSENRTDLADSEDVQIVIVIKEGPRFHRGEIGVSGATAQANQFLKNRLLQLITDEKKPKLIWRTSKPMNGSTLAKLDIETRVRDELNHMGCDGQSASVQFVRNAHELKVDLKIKLFPPDSGWMPKETLSDQAGVENEEDSNLDVTDDEDVERELLRVFRRNFEEPKSGIIVRQCQASFTASMGVGTDSTWVQLLRSNRDSDPAMDQSVCTLLEKDVMLVAATPTGTEREKGVATWAIPNFNFGFTMTQKATSESTGNNASSFKLRGNVRSGEKDDETKCGFRFSRLGWEQWFPSGSTKVEPTAGGRQFVFGANELTVDQSGDLVRLQGTTASGAILHIRRATNAEIRDACPSLIDQDNPQEIYVRRPKSQEPIALTEIARNVLFPRKEDHGFSIWTANGEKGLPGAVLLMFLNEENFVQRETLISRLAEIYALQLSGYSQTIPARLMEIHCEASTGPLTSFALGDLYARVGDLEKAKQAYESVLFLSEHDRSIRHDIELIVDKSNLLGQLVQDIDVKSLLQIGVAIESAGQTADTSPAATILAMMPEGVDESTRQENAKQVFRFLYQAKLHTPLRQMCVHRISRIQVKQLKIAAKAKAKAKKKKDDQAKKAAKKKPPLR